MWTIDCCLFAHVPPQHQLFVRHCCGFSHFSLSFYQEKRQQVINKVRGFSWGERGEERLLLFWEVDKGSWDLLTSISFTINKNLTLRYSQETQELFTQLREDTWPSYTILGLTREVFYGCIFVFENILYWLQSNTLSMYLYVYGYLCAITFCTQKWEGSIWEKTICNFLKKNLFESNHSRDSDTQPDGEIV